MLVAAGACEGLLALAFAAAGAKGDGEIGGTAEEDAAVWVAENFSKPLVGVVAGATAPPGKRMGHAGAIISGGKGTAEEKFAAFEAAGIHIARDPSKIGDVLLDVLIEAGLREY